MKNTKLESCRSRREGGAGRPAYDALGHRHVKVLPPADVDRVVPPPAVDADDRGMSFTNNTVIFSLYQCNKSL